MDPAGILMLRSVRIVFELLGIKPESIKFIKEEFNADNLVKALNEDPKKCPAILTINLETYRQTGDLSPHIMVASNALKGSEFIQGDDQIAEYLKKQWFINCKNSYRDDVEEPGTVCTTPFALSHLEGLDLVRYTQGYFIICIRPIRKHYQDVMKIPLVGIKPVLYKFYSETGYRFSSQITAFYISIKE